MKKLLCAAILCAAFIFATALPSGALMFSDVTASTSYREAIITLSTIGLLKGYEDGTFKPENTITRAEFTVMVTRALAVDSLKTNGDAFSDTQTHYAKNNIYTAYDMGIINGMGDGTFRPDAPVTYNQAVKMIVCMLGYGSNGEANGGYPDGYIKIASQLGITGTIPMAGETPAPRGVVSQLIYNSLEVKIQNKIILSDGTPSYAETSETLMEGRLQMYKIKGTVTGVADSLTEQCNAKLIEGEMAILSGKDTYLFDYTKFFKTTSEAKEYLGYYVTAYYKKGGPGDLEYIIAIDGESRRNDTLIIKSSDITECDGTSLRYENDRGRTKYMKIADSGVSVIYNGKSIDAFPETIDGVEYENIYGVIKALLSPDSGSFIYGDIKIVDTGSDSTADIITINDYDIYVASKAPTVSDYRVTDKIKSGKYIILDPTDSSYELSIKKNNADLAVTSIKANDIVMYAPSLDSKKRSVVVCDTKVTGKISSFDPSENEIKIDDKIYKIDDDLIDYLNDKDEFSAGMTGTFNVDTFGKIFFCTVQQSNTGTYGYLTNVTYDNETDTTFAHLFMPSTGSVKLYAFEDKPKMNGSAVSSYTSKLREISQSCSADLENAKRVYGSSADKVKNTGYAQPVRAEISSDKVKNLTVLSGEGAVNEKKSSIVRYMPLDKYKYTATNNFDNKFYINASTTIIYVPGDRGEKSDYAKMTASMMFKTGQSYWVEPYDVNESKAASLLIVYGNSSLAEITKDSQINIISKKPVVTVINDDNVLRITMYPSNSLSAVGKNTEDEDEFADLQVGDIFQFGYNNKSQMINKSVLIRAADVLEKLENEDFDWTDDKFVFDFKNTDGTVETDSETNLVYHRTYIVNVLEVSNDEENRFIRVTRSPIASDGTAEGEEERYDIPNDMKIIRFDTQKNEISNVVDGTTIKLTADDLRDAKYSADECSKIMLDVVKGKIRYVMIYE